MAGDEGSIDKKDFGDYALMFVGGLVGLLAFACFAFILTLIVVGIIGLWSLA